MRFVLLCLVCWLALPAHAVVVTQTVRPGIVAGADYLEGARNKPAVLLLHGFLQTREFPTVARLAGGLHDAGYTVLVPTLSLNIPTRAQSLACEAVQRHRLDEDLEEIAHWVRWLKKRRHRAIILAGHSYGSLQLLAYLSRQPDPAVKGFVGISLVEAGSDTPDARRRRITDLEDRARNAPRTLLRQPLSFCRAYTAPPADLLSYLRWDPTRTLDALKRVRVPMRTLMGGDRISSESWIRALRHVGASPVIIEGAGHFMDGEHEFDLLEQTLQFLGQFETGHRR